MPADNFTISSNGSQPTTDIGITLAELWIQLVFFYTFLGGILSAVGYSVVFISIYRQKKLRTRFFVIIQCLVICRAILSINMAVQGVQRITRTLNLFALIQTRIVCHLLSISFYTQMSIEMALLLILVIDRILAIMAVNFYKILTMKQAVTACVSCCALIFIGKSIFLYSTMNYSENVACLNLNSSPSAEFTLFSQYFDLIIGFSVFVLYSSLTIHLWRKTRLLKQSNDVSDEIALKRRLKLIPTLKNLVITHLSITTTAKALLFISSYVPAKDAPRMVAYAGIFVCIDQFANLVALIAANSDVRKSVKKFAVWIKVVNVKIEPTDQGTGIQPSFSVNNGSVGMNLWRQLRQHTLTG